LPPGFPRPLVPASNPMSAAKVELGRRLFRETRLSSTGSYACVSCHRPELAFTDGKPHAVGATGETVKHGAMSLANVAYGAGFTWSDSRVRSLESQMRRPLFGRHPVEMGLAGGHQAVEALSAAPGYPELFAAAFPGDGAPLSMDHIIKAIAAFERTLISGRSPFDRYVFDDDRTALKDSAKRGMALFYSTRVGCAQCHSGLNFSGPLTYEGQPAAHTAGRAAVHAAVHAAAHTAGRAAVHAAVHAAAHAAFANTGLHADDAERVDRGLADVTRRGSDMGKFRIPTLRNVALTAPYMHDGSLATLEEVIDHYARGGGGTAHQDRRIHPFALSPAERGDLVAFLHSLTDREFIDDPRFR
jgi:cytochrome c peroxidase